MALTSFVNPNQTRLKAQWQKMCYLRPRWQARPVVYSIMQAATTDRTDMNTGRQLRCSASDYDLEAQVSVVLHDGSQSSWKTRQLCLRHVLWTCKATYMARLPLSTLLQGEAPPALNR